MAMKKYFKYRGCEFVIIVELNTIVERRLNGKRWHNILIKTTETGDDGYLDSIEVTDDELELNVKQVIKTAKNWLDIKLDGKAIENEILKNLGFENC